MTVYQCTVIYFAEAETPDEAEDMLRVALTDRRYEIEIEEVED
jgi:hypothetical protein